MQLRERVGREARAGSIALHGIDLKLGLTGESELEHFDSSIEGRDFLVEFVRRPGAGNEQNPIEMRLFAPVRR